MFFDDMEEEAPQKKELGLSHALFMAFYSPKIYQEAAVKWKGFGFTYLLYAIAIAWIPLAVFLHIKFADFAERRGPDFVQQIPDINIASGKASTTAETPYFINDPETGKPVAIIDMTGKYKSLDNTEAYVLLTDSNLYLYDLLGERAHDLKVFGDMEIKKDKAYDALDGLKEMLAFILYPIMVGYTFLTRALKLVAYAAIGIFIARRMNLKADFGMIMRIAAVSATPVIAVDIALWFAGIPEAVLFWDFLGGIAALLYLNFGIKSVSRDPMRAF